MREDLIAWKWVESLSEEQQSVLISGSIKRLQSIIATAITAARAEQREVDARKCEGVVGIYEDTSKTHDEWGNQYSARIQSEGAHSAKKCATAIRAGKE